MKKDTSNDYCKINGVKIRLSAAAQMMDDEIRENIHSRLAPCSAQRFATAYCKAHKAKFNETFTVC